MDNGLGRSNVTMYVLTDKEYYEVQEKGYQTLYVQDLDEVDGVENGWSMEQKVLYYIWKHGDCSCFGVCHFNHYFVRDGRLLSMGQLAGLLQEQDVVFSNNGLNCSEETVECPVFLMSGKCLDGYMQMLAGSPGEVQEPDLRTWVKEQGIRAGYHNTEYIDTGRMPQMYATIEELTDNLIAKYQKGNRLRLPQIDREVGADGRIPVWICWWQGVETAPVIVQKCIRSIRANLPQDRADIRIVTFENYRRYVTFSETIEKRFCDGALSLTHLSDVLRVQLLCRYGGLWIDATCMIWDDRFVEQLLAYPFFTRKAGGAYNELDIVSGRWGTYFMKGPAGFSLFGFLVEAFEQYWEKYDSLLNYFLFDYIIAVAYDHLPDVRMILDAVPVNNRELEILAVCGNQAFDKRKLDILTSETWLFKWTYKERFAEKTPDGEETFFYVSRERY